MLILFKICNRNIAVENGFPILINDNLIKRYILPGEENKDCKLRKAIYGLKQATRVWNIKISESLEKIFFVQSTANACLSMRKTQKSTTYIIIFFITC